MAKLKHLRGLTANLADSVTSPPNSNVIKEFLAEGGEPVEIDLLSGEIKGQHAETKKERKLADFYKEWFAEETGKLGLNGHIKTATISLAFKKGKVTDYYSAKINVKAKYEETGKVVNFGAAKSFFSVEKNMFGSGSKRSQG